MREGWIAHRFDEVFDLQMGKTPARDNPSYWGEGNVWVSIADMKDVKYISSSKEQITDIAVSESGIKMVKKGTTIMSFKLSIGKAAIANTDLFTNEAIMSFTVKEGHRVKPEFIYYFLKGFKWAGANKAVMGFTLNKKTIASNIFSYPPIAEQEKIVAELDCLTGIIEKKQQQLKELDKLAQSIFYDMFGDPITNEKGWEVIRLEDLCDITSSKRIYANEYVDSGIPFFRGKEITEKSKGNSISVELFINQSRYDDLKRKFGVPPKGDLLLTAVGTIGNIWEVDTDEPFYFKDGNVLWLHSKEKVNSTYFKHLLSVLIDARKREMANGCAYSALTIVNLKEMPTNLVPLDLQYEFAKKIEAIEKQKEFVKQSIVETETLFNSRMDYWFN